MYSPGIYKMMFSAKNDNVIIVEIPNPRKLGTRGLGMKVTQQGGEGGGARLWEHDWKLESASRCLWKIIITKTYFLSVAQC